MLTYEINNRLSIQQVIVEPGASFLPDADGRGRSGDVCFPSSEASMFRTSDVIGLPAGVHSGGRTTPAHLSYAAMAMVESIGGACNLES